MENVRLAEANKVLHTENERLKRENERLKEENGKLVNKNLNLEHQIKDLRFTKTLELWESDEIPESQDQNVNENNDSLAEDNDNVHPQSNSSTAINEIQITPVGQQKDEVTRQTNENYQISVHLQGILTNNIFIIDI